MPSRPTAKTRAAANPPVRRHPRAGDRAVVRAEARPAGPRRRLLRVTGIVLAAATLYLAGTGTGLLVMRDRMEGRMAALLGAGGTAAPGADTPNPGAAPGPVDLQQWAREQGLPEGLPEPALTLLHQRFPDEIPQDIREQILQKLGSG